MARRKKKDEKGAYGCLILCLVGLLLFAVSIGRLASAFKNPGGGVKNENTRKSDVVKKKPSKNALFRTKLDFLVKREEFAWYKIKDGDVFMAFKGDVMPKDYKKLANTVAKIGSENMDGKIDCKVWVVSEKTKVDEIRKNVNHLENAKVFYETWARLGTCSESDE